MAKYECEGQLSLFDLFETPKEETKSDVSEIRDRELLRGSGFAEGKTRIYNYFKAGHTEKERIDFLKKEYGIGGWSTKEGFLNHDANGIDIKFNELIGKTSALHLGWMMVSKRIDELIEEGLYKPNVCKFSEHTCNKEELWKVAESFDDIECPKVCCRNCKVKCCGARCNGSEEPKEEEPKCSKAKECEAYPIGCGGSTETCRWGGPFRWWPKESNEAAVDYETWHDIEEPPPENAFCLFEYLWTMNAKEDSKGQCAGWWKNGKVTWFNMPWDIGKKRVTRWKFKEEEKEEPKEVNVRGLLDDGYCPECDGAVDDLAERCPYCGTLLSWNEWRKANGEAESG